MSTLSSIMPHFPEMWFEHSILDLHNLWPFSIADEIINIIALIHFYYFFWKKPDISMHPQNPQKNLSYHFGIKEIFTESETVEAQKPTKHTHTQTPQPWDKLSLWKLQHSWNCISPWDEITRDFVFVLHLISLERQRIWAGSFCGEVYGSWYPKAERKKALYTSTVISAIQALKLFQNPVFLSIILSLCTTGNKGHFWKGKLYLRKR